MLIAVIVGISLAMVIMAQIYEENKIPLQLVQVKEPQFIADPDKPPETSFQKSDSLLSDADSMHVIFQAIVVMAKFYEGNKNPFQQVQVKELEFRVDPDKAPETNFQKSDRSGKSGTDAVHVISRARNHFNNNNNNNNNNNTNRVNNDRPTLD